MRLFIAVNFSEDIKTNLYTTAMRLKDRARYGNFSRRENLHLTLVFIGETGKLSDVKAAMDKVAFSPFEIEMSRLGRFKRSGGDIYWVGVEKSDELSRIAGELSDNLRAAGFKIESREFKPHLTLAREVVMEDDFDMRDFSRSIKPMNFKVSRISLMKSERIAGKLTYSEVYGVSSKNV